MTERISFGRYKAFVVIGVGPFAIDVNHACAAGFVDESARVIALPCTCFDYTTSSTTRPAVSYRYRTSVWSVSRHWVIQPCSSYA